LVAPSVVAVSAIGIWLAISDLVLEPDRQFLLPPPQDVVREGLLDGQHRSQILHGLWATTKVSVTGLVLAIVIGTLLALLMSMSRVIEYSIFPYAVVLQTIPVLAMVPLLGFWFGFDFSSRVLVCVLISIFPIITNTLFGLKSVDAGLRDLFTLYRGSRRDRLFRLQVPAALPAALTGCKIASGLAVIGAIVADFFFRQGEPGIGRLIDIYRMRLETELLITALVFSSLLGLVLFLFFDRLAERVARGRTARR
jgi:NitT/TauT family transport system permease protein